MVKLVRTFKKSCIDDNWITADTTEYFSKDEIENIIKPWFYGFTCLPGFVSSETCIEGNTMTCSTIFNTVEQAHVGAQYLSDKTSDLSKKRLELFSKVFKQRNLERYKLSYTIIES